MKRSLFSILKLPIRSSTVGKAFAMVQAFSPTIIFSVDDRALYPLSAPPATISNYKNCIDIVKKNCPAYRNTVTTLVRTTTMGPSSSIEFWQGFLFSLGYYTKLTSSLQYGSAGNVFNLNLTYHKGPYHGCVSLYNIQAVKSTSNYG